jgi:hypothetical protein
MHRLVALALMAVLLVAGCATTPTDGRIRSQVVAALSAHGADQLYDIDNFNVVSGKAQDDGTYRAKVHYDIVLKQGFQHLPHELQQDPKLFKAVLALGGVVARAALSGTPIKAGAHLPVDDEVTLVKGDDGWVLQ